MFTESMEYTCNISNLISHMIWREGRWGEDIDLLIIILNDEASSMHRDSLLS